MLRKQDERIGQAREMYLNGSKLIEIANSFDIPEGTVRSWKNRYKWDDDSNATLQKNVAHSRETKTLPDMVHQRKIIMQKSTVSSRNGFRWRPFPL